MPLDLTKKAAPAPPPSKPKAKVNTSRKRAREDAINGIFQLTGAGLMMMGQVPDAAAIAQHGPNIASETASIAESNDGLGRVIDYLTSVGPYAALIAAVMPLTLQLLANHGKVPASALAQFGVIDPDVLRVQAEAEAMQMAAQAMEDAKTMQSEASQMMSANNDA